MSQKKGSDATEKKSNAGQPKTFESGEELIRLFTDFCKDIKDNDYDEVPTRTAFASYLGEHFKPTDKRTVYNALNEYFPHVKNDFLEILSDTLVAGAAKGKYKEAIVIFALKNWCKWTDKQENVNTNLNANESLDDLTPEERQKRIAELLEKGNI
jgi:hypothetical protein